MKGYKVPVHSIVISSFSEDQEFGQWEEVRDITLEGKAVKTDDVPDVVTSLSFSKGDIAYVVWAVWTYGDSFGECVECNYEVFGIFRTKEVAQELLEQLKNHDDSMIYTFTNKTHDIFKTSDGQEHKIPIILEWEDYFSQLDLLEIAQVIVQ